MEKEALWKYYENQEALLEALSESMTSDGPKVNLAKIYEILGEICKLFRISKGVTEFYKNPEYERIGKGEVFVCYDTGEECAPAIIRRIVTQSMTVAKCTVFMRADAEPFNEEEYRRVDLIMRTVLSFLSRNRLETQVERLTFYDDNGYRNLQSFMRYLRQLNEKHALYGHTAIIFNLRHFSMVNQEIGRNAGDIAMKNYFDLIDQIIGDQGIICRLGGDNFVGVFRNVLYDKIVSVMHGVPVVYDVNSGKRINISAAAGVFVMPADLEWDNPGDIMTRLNAAAHSAKVRGKDIVQWDDDMNISKQKAMRIQSLFPQAMENEEFQVFYQPKIDVETGELVGAEALCRWFREGKIVPPIEFIPVLEQNTEICKLDFYMLDHVCRDIRRWLDEGRKVVRISVNLSRKHMMDVDLLERILNIVDQNRVPHHCIEIELTETTTDVEFRDLKRVVSGLQQAGICTSVDDFGMGYSSLNLIREIPWNVLKVDRSFLPVDEDTEHSTRSIMFKYVVAMAKEMGLECIAEGVETKQQVDVLRDNRCPLAQGYFFDKPLPLSDFEERLTSRHYEIKDS